MESRYTEWAGPLMDMGRFEWERVIKKCTFKQNSTKLVALLLATYASEDGTSVRPGRERLSTVAGLSAKHVSTQLGKLEDLGLVLKLHNGSSYGRRGGLASVYRLTAPSELYQIHMDDPSELEQVQIEKVYEFLTGEQGNSSSPVSQEQGNPSSHVSKPKSQEHVNSESEQGNSGTEHVNSDAEHVNPSSPHQAFTPSNSHQSKIITQTFSGPFGNAYVAPAKALNEGLSLEDERSRQMAALQERMKKQGRKAS